MIRTSWRAIVVVVEPIAAFEEMMMNSDAKKTISIRRYNNNSDTAYHLPILGIGLLGTLLLVYFAGVHAADLAGATLLVIASAVMSWHLSRRHRKSLSRAIENAAAELRLEFERSASEEKTPDLEEICKEAVPIWVLCVFRRPMSYSCVFQRPPRART